MGLYVDYWYMSQAGCEMSYCPLITIWNITPILILCLVFFMIGVWVGKRIEEETK